MEHIIQPLVSGIAMGFIYCLIAIEYTLVFNTSGLMNFGHDRYILFGAYVFAGSFVLQWGFETPLGIALSILMMFVMGVALATVAFIPLRKKEPILAVTGTLAMSMIVFQLARILYGPAAFTVQGLVTGSFNISGVIIPRIYVIIIIVGILLLIGQNLLLTKTKVGKATRAISQDMGAASMMGINVNQMLRFTVGLSLAICGIIGILLIPMYGVSLSMTNSIGTKGFVAGILGGFGSINGAIAGGLLVGIVEAIYLILGGPGIYKDMISFVLIIIFLLFRPQGLLNNTKM